MDRPDLKLEGDTPASQALEIVAWCVLLLCVIAAVALQRLAPPDPAVVDTVRPDVEQVVAGRLVVGWHHIGRRLDPSGDATLGGPMLADFEEAAEGPMAQLRLAVLEAEVAGPTAAAERITRVLAALDEQPEGDAADVTRRRRAPPSDLPDLPDMPGLPAPPDLLDERQNDDGQRSGEMVVRRPTPDMVRQDAWLLLTIYGSEAGEAGEQAREAPPGVVLDELARSELVDRHGWFGRLALSHETGPEAAPPGLIGRPVSEAVRAAVATVAVTGGLLVLAAVGLVLLILAIVFWLNGRLARYYHPVRRPTGPFLEAMTLFLVLMLFLSVAMAFISELTGLPLLPLLYLIVPLSMFWPLVRGVGWRQWQMDMGWHRGRGIWREVGSGLVGYVAGLPIIAAGLALTLILSALLAEDGAHPVSQEVFTGDFWQLVAVLALAVIWAPVVEEALFRGAFYHYMRRRWNALLSGLVVGLIFAAIHPQGIVGIPVLTAVAVVFALIREWRGSLIGPVTAHAVHNFAATLVMLLVMR